MRTDFLNIFIFLLYTQLLLIDKKITEVSPLLTQAGYLVDNWQASQYQKEYLKVFFLVLQVMISIILIIFHVSIFHQLLLFKGMSLFNGWASKECQTMFKTVTTKYSDNHAAYLAL